MKMILTRETCRERNDRVLEKRSNIWADFNFCGRLSYRVSNGAYRFGVFKKDNGRQCGFDNDESWVPSYTVACVMWVRRYIAQKRETTISCQSQVHTLTTTLKRNETKRNETEAGRYCSVPQNLV